MHQHLQLTRQTLRTGPGHDRHADDAVIEQIDHLALPTRAYQDLDVWMRCMERGEGRPQKGARQRLEQPDRGAASATALGLARELYTAVEQLNRTPRIRQKRCPKVRQLHAAAAPHQQWATNGALQAADAFTDGRLGDVQCACGAAEGPFAHNALKGEQLARIHLHRKDRYSG